MRRILGEKTTTSIMPLKQVQNGRLIHALGPRDPLTSTLRNLRWLPFEQLIIFKLCSLMHLVNTGHSPQYLQELVLLTSEITSIVLVSTLQAADVMRRQ